MSENHYHNPHNCNYYNTTKTHPQYQEQPYPEQPYQPNQPYVVPDTSNKTNAMKCIKILPRDFIPGCQPRIVNTISVVVVNPVIPINTGISMSFMNGHLGRSVGALGNGFSLVNNGSVFYEIEDTLTTTTLGVVTPGNWVTVVDVAEKLSIYDNIIDILNSNSHLKYTCGITNGSNLMGLGINDPTTIIQKIDTLNNAHYTSLFRTGSNVYRVGLQLAADPTLTLNLPYLETTVLNIEGTLQILLAKTTAVESLSNSTSIIPHQVPHYPGFMLDPLTNKASVCLCDNNSNHDIYPNPKIYTTIDIPNGYKACQVKICGTELTSSLKVRVYEGFVCEPENDDVVNSVAQGNVNSIIQLSPGICNKGCSDCSCDEEITNKPNYLIIEVEDVSPRIHSFYGGYITIKGCDGSCETVNLTTNTI